MEKKADGAPMMACDATSGAVVQWWWCWCRVKIVENSTVATGEHMKKKKKKQGKRDLKSEKRQVKRKTGKGSVWDWWKIRYLKCDVVGRFLFVSQWWWKFALIKEKRKK